MSKGVLKWQKKNNSYHRTVEKNWSHTKSYDILTKDI